MSTLIECGTCGYPLTPEEREGLVEIDGKMCKPRKPLTDAFLEELAEKHVTDCYFDTLTYAREIERAHYIGGEE